MDQTWHRLDARNVDDRLSELGTVVRLLRTTLDSLKEHLAPEPIKQVSRDRLVKQARRWRIPVAMYERHFHEFRRKAQRDIPHETGLQLRFTEALRAR